MKGMKGVHVTDLLWVAIFLIVIPYLGIRSQLPTQPTLPEYGVYVGLAVTALLILAVHEKIWGELGTFRSIAAIGFMGLATLSGGSCLAVIF